MKYHYQRTNLQDFNQYLNNKKKVYNESTRPSGVEFRPRPPTERLKFHMSVDFPLVILFFKSISFIIKMFSTGNSYFKLCKSFFIYE